MRRGILIAAILWLTPILGVGAAGLGLPASAAIVAGLIGAAGIAVPGSRRLAAALHDGSRVPKALAAALILVTLVSIAQFAALSVFIADVNRPAFSVEPHDSFRVPHSCMSAYAEAARFTGEGDHNIYERNLYMPGGKRRSIGPLIVDAYHYPPPFLLLPQAIRVAAPEFFDFRRVWFAVQALTFAFAVAGFAGWIGGRRGRLTLLGGMVLLALPHVPATLQQGNFQVTAAPLAVAGFILLVCRHHAVGAGVLAYAALAKIFPGILILPLLGARKWRATTWVAAMGVALVVLTVAVQGLRPMRDFVGTSLPEISTGAAFPQTESPQHARVNFSAYGQTVRLRVLGASWLTQPRGLMVAQVYGIAVVLLAGWAGWRMRFDTDDATQRAALAQAAVALVSLASFRSPFVGAVYGGVSTLWVMAFLAATASPAGARVWIIGQVVLGMLIWELPSPAKPTSQPWVWISGALMLACMAINAWAVIAAVQSSRSVTAGSMRQARRAGTSVAPSAATTSADSIIA